MLCRLSGVVCRKRGSVANVVPLWHGVELARGMALGFATTWSPVAHVGYLVLWIVGGTLVAFRTFRTKLRR